jgi:RimJ/RimL family protein N-acetyltransferase
MYAELSTPEVKRFMWAPPPTADAFERFIEWAHTERATGKYICFGIVPTGEEHAVGVFELRQLQPGFFRGELGFVMAQRLWGSGAFMEGARLVLEFGFRAVKIHRIEARAAVDNDRGNAALSKIGARREGRLRQAFLREGEYVDQYLWAILDTDWYRLNPQPSER